MMSNECLVKMYKQICFASQQTANKLVQRYTHDELRQKAALRHISESGGLESLRKRMAEVLTRELYILDVTRMTTTWTVDQIHSLAKSLDIDMTKFPDTTHICWMIALVLVRDRVTYEFTKHRHIRLVN